MAILTPLGFAGTSARGFNSSVGTLRRRALAMAPVQPNPLDVAAQEDGVRVIAELGKSDKANFVLNRVDARASLLTRETLLRLGKMVPDSPIRPVESDSEPIL